MTEEPAQPTSPHASAPAGAHCAQHPERPAVATCVRCGNYVCTSCAAAPGGVCRACALRGVAPEFPFRRDDFSAEGLLNLALAHWKRHWFELAAVTAAFFAVSYLPGFLLFGDRPELSELAHGELLLLVVEHVGVIMLDTAATLLLFGYLLDLLQNKPRGLDAVLRRLRAVPTQWLAFVLIYLGAGLFLLGALLIVKVLGLSVVDPRVLGVGLLCVPGFVYVSTGLAFLTFDLAFDPHLSAIAALRGTWALVAGYRLRVMNVLMLSGFVMFLGVFGCLIGVLATFPIGTLFYAGMYLALKRTR